MRNHFPTHIARRHRGFTMVELLVIVVIVGVLLALMLPAIQSVRSAARRAQCQTNLRSIGQALLSVESSTGRLPAGRDQSNWGDHSWATRILPSVEEQDTFDNYNWQRSWWHMGTSEWSSPWELEYVNGQRDDVEGNLEVATTEIPVFVCPETSHNFKGAIDYGGNYGSSITGMKRGFAHGQAWESGLLVATNLKFMDKARRRGVRSSEVRDGMSHTFMVIEDAGRRPEQGGMWANGHNCFSPDGQTINLQRSNEIYSDHGKLAHALLGDGSVMAITEDMDIQAIGAMSTRNGHDSQYQLQ